MGVGADDSIGEKIKWQRYENIKKEEEIERYENIIQELKKREMEGPRVFYQALHEIYDPQRGGDKSKVIQLMSSYHKSLKKIPISLF